jgi:hypothetical protein
MKRIRSWAAWNTEKAGDIEGLRWWARMIRYREGNALEQEEAPEVAGEML